MLLRPLPSSLCGALLFALTPAAAGPNPGKIPAASASTSASPSSHLLTGEDFSIGGVLFPHIHFSAAWGRTGFDPETAAALAAGHHDPIEDGWALQGFELGLSGRFGEYLESFTTWHGFWKSGSPHDFDSEFEEYFLKLKNIPGNLELRGGRFLNRFGLHNASHQHAWDWADNHLISGRFLGDDGLSSDGAELTWTLPFSWTSALSFSVGDVRGHDHDHHDHGHHEEEEHEESASLFEAGGATFSGTLLTANWTNILQINDFHQWRLGASAAGADNLWNRTTLLYGLHSQYEWRKNGLERGGDYFRWRTEIMLREARALTGHLHEDEHAHEEEEHEEPGDHAEGARGSFREWGLYTSAVYGRAFRHGILEGALRYDYLDGAEEAGLPSRHRFSPGVTYYLNSLRSGFLRAQANFDRIKDRDSETSVWLSVGFNWGGPEVR